MNEDIYTKFPIGGSWWLFKHPKSAQWTQQNYDTPAPYPIKATENMHHDKYVQQPKNLKETTEKSKLSDVCECILHVIDPCASLYTYSQRMDASTYLRQRLFNFVSSEAHFHFGPKKSRTLAMWLSGNRTNADAEGIIRNFLILLLGEQAREWELFLDRRGSWMVKK